MHCFEVIIKHNHVSESPLAIEINHFITFITLFAVIFGVMFFIMAVMKGHDALSAFIYLIGIITANVPEGLLPTLTVSNTCIPICAQGHMYCAVGSGHLG